MNAWAMFHGLHEATGLEFHDVAYHSRIQDWRHVIAMPNNTTPYIIYFRDLGGSPVVNEIPASADGNEIGGIVHFDAGYYGRLHDGLEREFIEEKALAMMGMLQAMGIERGRPYRTDERRDAILDDAAKAAHE